MQHKHVDFDVTIDRRGTDSVKWDTVPGDVIPLSLADADWATAPAVVDSVRRAIAGMPVFGYSFGGDAIATAAVDWFKRVYDVDVDPAWIVETNGIVSDLSALSKLADGAVLQTVPNYVMMLRAPERAEKRLVTAPMRETVSADGTTLTYGFDFAAMEVAISSHRVLQNIFMFCNPHNPLGKVYSRQELEAIVDFVHRHSLIAVSDEIHCELTLGDVVHIPYFTVDPDNSVTLYAPGKICNMPGIPSAFAVIPNPELRERVRRLIGHGGHGALNRAATVGAFSPECDHWKEEVRKYLLNNRDFVEREFRCRLPRLKFPHNDGTYLLWLDFSDYSIEDAPKFLLERAKVALTNGVEFGGQAQHARLNFACPRTTLAEAISRIVNAVN